MTLAIPTNVKNVLLTGQPGCGKTTVILRLVELASDLRLAGFYTEDLRDRGQRVGFEAVGLSSGLRCVLAHTRSRSRIKVGRYGVEPERLVPLMHTELQKNRRTPRKLHPHLVNLATNTSRWARYPG